MESLNKEDYEAKDKAFYSAMISAWLNTKLERDKQLLSLSVTAIGLLVTLLRTTGVTNVEQLYLFGFALFAFLVTVISVIYILGENAVHIEKALDNSETESKMLIHLDKIAGISFVVGMVLIVIIGMHSAFINLNDKGEDMSQEKPSDTRGQSVQNNDSWNGVSKLRPQPPKAAQKPDTEPAASADLNPSATSGDNNNTGKGADSNEH